MARKIREKAEDSGIHIFEEPQLARALFFTTEVNQDIPRLLFEAVAGHRICIPTKYIYSKR